VLKFSEVYEKQIKATNERPDGSEFVTYTTGFSTRDCLINPEFIVAVHPHEFTSDLTRQKMSEFFPEGTKFSTLILDGNSFRKSEIIVVGSFEKMCERLGK
jgi:hypothetical protein